MKIGMDVLTRKEFLIELLNFEESRNGGGYFFSTGERETDGKTHGHEGGTLAINSSVPSGG